MLDQNTDRMWYVIGAVIIGAAIIFILNGTMPELFASVGGTFEDKAIETTEIVDGIRPNTRNGNLLSYGSVQMEGGYRMLLDGSIQRIISEQPEFLRHEDLAPIIDKYGIDQRYTLRFEIKSKDTSKASEIKVYMQNGSSSKYRFAPYNGAIDKWMPVTEEFQQMEFTGIAFTHDPVDIRYDAEHAHLSFYGGAKGDTVYGNGNVPVVRNIELILED